VTRPSAGVLTLSVDYSVDELDALADAFGVAAFGSDRLGRGGTDAVLRATLATALRGLVARRAIALGGSAATPRIELLEPHGTILGTALGAARIVRVEVVDPAGIRSWVVFARGGVAVEQHALPAQPAILRMTAHPAERFEGLVLDPLGTPVDGRDRPGREALLLSTRMLSAASRELAAAGAPAAVVDLVHARRRRIELVDLRRDGSRVERRTTGWLDAGELGWWRLEPEADEDAAVVRAIPCSSAALAAVLRPEGSRHR
jgi:hypothetical protein